MKRAIPPEFGTRTETPRMTVMILAAVVLAATSVVFAQGQGGCDIPRFFGTDNVACYNGAYYVIDGTQLRMLDQNMEQIEAVRFYSDDMYDQDAERLGDLYGGLVDEGRLMVNDEGVFVMHAGRVYRFDHQLNQIDAEVLFETPQRFRRSERRFDLGRGRYGRRYRTPEYYYPPGYNPRPPGTYYFDDRYDPRLRTPPGWYNPPGTGTPPGFYDPPQRPGWYRAPGQGNSPGWYSPQPSPPGWYETPQEREERERRERHRNNPFRW